MNPTKPEDRSIDPDNIWLCPQCDLIVPKSDLAFTEQAFCPECGFKIACNGRYSPHLALALSISGLLLLIPAFFLPLLHMTLFLQVTDHSVFSGIRDFISQGMWVPALLIFFGTLASPFIYLFLNIFLLSCLQCGFYNKLLYPAIKVIQKIRSWGMLEVYLLGVIIAIIKLGDIARVYPGFGLGTLAGVMICQSLVALIVRPADIWESVEALKNQKQGNKV